MVEVILFVLGCGAGFFYARRSGFMAREKSQGRRIAGAESLRPEIVEQALVDIEKTDPELAEQLSAEPAVEPEDVPFIVDEKTQASPEFHRMIERVANPLLQQTLQALHGWHPRSRTGDERGYVKSMLGHLTKSGFTSKDFQTEPRIKWRENSARWVQPDVIACGKVLIEIKADLGTSAASDRSLGQMLRYLLAWKDKGPAILIICGACEPIMRMVIAQYVESGRTSLRLPVTVWFAREGKIDQVEGRVDTREAVVAR